MIEFLGSRLNVATTTSVVPVPFPAVAGIERADGLSVIARGGTVVFSIGSDPTASSGWPVAKDQWAILPFVFPMDIRAIGGSGISFEYQWVANSQEE